MYNFTKGFAWIPIGVRRSDRERNGLTVRQRVDGGKVRVTVIPRYKAESESLHVSIEWRWKSRMQLFFGH